MFAAKLRIQTENGRNARVLLPPLPLSISLFMFGMITFICVCVCIFLCSIWPQLQSTMPFHAKNNNVELVIELSLLHRTSQNPLTFPPCLHNPLKTKTLKPHISGNLNPYLSDINVFLTNPKRLSVSPHIYKACHTHNTTQHKYNTNTNTIQHKYTLQTED